MRELEIATEAAKAAGAILKKGFGATCSFESKEGRHNLVTEYDKKCEQAIFDVIRSFDPEAYFLAEESGAVGQKRDEMWIIDPLDGTVNFAHHIPFFCVSIAYAQEDEVQCGVIYEPITGELFTTSKGGGAHLGDRKLNVSETEGNDSFTATGFPYCTADNPLKCIDHFSSFCHSGMPIRLLGSAALHMAYVAAGRIDAFWEVLLNPWDYAAGALMVAEAGGIATHYDGSSLYDFAEGTVLATNTLLHPYMQETLC